MVEMTGDGDHGICIMAFGAFFLFHNFMAQHVGSGGFYGSMIGLKACTIQLGYRLGCIEIEWIRAPHWFLLLEFVVF